MRDAHCRIGGLTDCPPADKTSRCECPWVPFHSTLVPLPQRRSGNWCRRGVNAPSCSVSGTAVLHAVAPLSYLVCYRPSGLALAQRVAYLGGHPAPDILEESTSTHHGCTGHGKRNVLGKQQAASPAVPHGFASTTCRCGAASRSSSTVSSFFQFKEFLMAMASIPGQKKTTTVFLDRFVNGFSC